MSESSWDVHWKKSFAAVDLATNFSFLRCIHWREPVAEFTYARSIGCPEKGVVKVLKRTLLLVGIKNQISVVFGLGKADSHFRCSIYSFILQLISLNSPFLVPFWYNGRYELRFIQNFFDMHFHCWFQISAVLVQVFV